MNILHIGSLIAVLGVAGVAVYSGALGGSHTREGYVRSEVYERCDRDYLQSARHLRFSASSSECECFDDKLQQLTASQRSAAYKALEHRLTLAFMGRAGAEVDGHSVSFNDSAFGQVDANVRIETSGTGIMEQCSMF